MKRTLFTTVVLASVAALCSTAARAFVPTDPLASRQWYLAQNRAFDLWASPPPLAPVLVALIDSGIDRSHPEFDGKIADGKSFVGGSPWVDEQGHGTIVAGIVAAGMNNGQGIAGMGFPARLLIAKVVRRDRSIPLAAEASAIRWAADRGADVINLSLGGVRDPLQRDHDTFSPVEAAAVEYAYRKGAVLVAAVGNADQAPSMPWNFASYPAALPHVIGVSALARDGSVPPFSDRDAIYNDIAAPGQDIFSTFPRPLTSFHPGCENQGYTECAGDDYRHPEGTSFAAPQVTAAAALLLAFQPALGLGLTPDQVSAVLTRSATDATAANGCRRCPAGRDAFAGWGRLDVTAALSALSDPAQIPAADQMEPNDDAGLHAGGIPRLPVDFRATLDFWDDAADVYRLKLRGGERLTATLRGPAGTNANLILWKPGTKHVEGLSLRALKQRATLSAGPSSREQLRYRVGPRGGGSYFVQVKLAQPGFGQYELRLAKS